jgi:hypothetical protein
MTIETKKLVISEELKRKVEMICKFAYVDYPITNGSIKSINIAMIKPHIVKIKDINYLIFDESDDIFINGYEKKIKLKDFKELEDMLEFAVKLNKPVIIRYPRGGEDSKVKFERHENIELGKAEVLKKIIDEEKSNKTKILQKIGDKVFNNKTQRERVTIIAIGKMVARAMDIGQRLQEKMDVEVINARFLKPLDDNTIIESIKKTKNVITKEDAKSYYTNFERINTKCNIELHIVTMVFLNNDNKEIFRIDGPDDDDPTYYLTITDPTTAKYSTEEY